jgi:hypothetical protein
VRRRPLPKLQPFYRISELVRLTDTSRGRVLRMLVRAGVRMRWEGGQRLVYVADLKKRMPVLWRSIVACEQAHVVARAVERLNCDGAEG